MSNKNSLISKVLDGRQIALLFEEAAPLTEDEHFAKLKWRSREGSDSSS